MFACLVIPHCAWRWTRCGWLTMSFLEKQKRNPDQGNGERDTEPDGDTDGCFGPRT